ncbi:MAG: DNA-binding protein [Candidatus Cloacimonadota bacterium]|nr:MAG: DNA-binding protein [Candidatus Cloacimonadota bacterium]
MARPKRCRLVNLPPKHVAFKPTGIPANMLKKEIMTIDEYEAIRLADFEQLEHLESAKYMGVSRPTFSRVLDSARFKIAKMLTQGVLLEIEGGKIHFKNRLYRCNRCQSIIRFSLEEENIKCAECGSEDLTDYLEKYGHGECCRKNMRDMLPAKGKKK